MVAPARDISDNGSDGDDDEAHGQQQGLALMMPRRPARARPTPAALARPSDETHRAAAGANRAACSATDLCPTVCAPSSAKSDFAVRRAARPSTMVTATSTRLPTAVAAEAPVAAANPRRRASAAPPSSTLLGAAMPIVCASPRALVSAAVVANLMRAGARATAGLVRGTGVTVLRDAPFSGIYYMTYEWCRARAAASPALAAAPPIAVNLLSGLLGGALATVLTNPADVIRVRMQLHPHRFATTVASLRTIVRVCAGARGGGRTIAAAVTYAEAAAAWRSSRRVLRA